MAKRYREGAEVSEVSPLMSLQKHPVSLLVPKQFTVPFTTPFDVNIPSDSITFSQNDINDDLGADYSVTLLESDIFQNEDPDLKFVKFKKPYVKVDSNEELPHKHENENENENKKEKESGSQMAIGLISEKQDALLNTVSPVTKKDYLKQDLKVQKVNLLKHFDPQNDFKYTDENIDLSDPENQSIFQEICKTLLSDSIENKNDYNLLETHNETSRKPDFTYDSTINRNEFLSLVNNEFVRMVYKLHESDIEIVNKIEAVSDTWFSYVEIFQDEICLPKLDIMNTLKSKLSELIKSNTFAEIDSQVYMWLNEICINILKESHSIDWDFIFQNEFIFKNDEYNKFIFTVAETCSILILLHSINSNDKLFTAKNDFSYVIDFVCDFGSVIKTFYNHDNIVEYEPLSLIVKYFSQLLVNLNQNIELLQLNDSLITRIEYTAFDVIFADILINKERHQFNEVLESLRAIFSDSLIQLYQKYDDQRIFIFNELVDNFHLLNPLKSRAKNYRMDCGISVQLISILIIRLIQSHSNYGQNFDFSQWEYLYSNHKTKTQKLQLQEINDGFWNSINEQRKSMIHSTSYFISNFLKKILSTYTAITRKIVENIFSDFIDMFELPEFPAVGIILDVFLDSSLSICIKTDESITGAHTLFFELIGLIGSKILNLKNLYGFTKLASDISLESFQNISSDWLTMLSYHKFTTNIYLNNKELFKFKSLIWLSVLNTMKINLSKILNSDKDPLLGEALETKKKLLKLVENSIYQSIELANQAKSSTDIQALSESQMTEINKKILSSQPLVFRYNEILGFILSSLNNPKAKSRTMAIKNLTLLVSREPTLLCDPRLRNIITIRMKDTFATVTDAILDLLFKMLESKPEYIPEYYELIAQKILDPSVNVKKKVVNLIKFVYYNTNEIKIKVRMIQSLLIQIDDDEDRIVDLVCYTLCELLFLELGKEYTENLNVDTINLQYKANITISVLCGVFSANNGLWTSFQRFLEEKVMYKSSFNKNFKLSLDSALDILVDFFLEMLTDTVDKSENYLDPESILGVLATFIKCDEKLISQDQLITLQPYFINDYSLNNISFYALEILNVALNHHKILNKLFLNSCKDSILKRLTKFNSKEMDAGVQCLWKLHLIGNDTVVVSRACISTLKLLLPYIKTIKDHLAEFKPSSSLQRLLYLLGDFGRYCDFERDRLVFNEANLGLQPKEAISTFLLKYILQFCNKSIKSQLLRKIAIKNALSICIASPKMFFSVPIAKLISNSFKKKDMVIINTIVGSLLIFLELEEVKMIKKNGLEVKRSSSIKLDVAIFHGYSLDYVNNGLCATLVQKYMNNILATCLETDGEIAINSVKFLKLVIKFGFANPKLCFPTVSALECSNSKYIRNIAIGLHRFLFEKFETLVESTYSEALKTTINYVFKIYKLEEIDKCESFLKTFFRIVKQRSQQKVDKFIQSILRIFNSINIYKIQKMKSQELINVQNQVLFLSINLNEMEFTSQFEVLTVINSIEKIILSEENFFEGKSNTLLDIFADENEEEDDIERLRYIVLGRIIICFKFLLKGLIFNYSISPELLLKFQESENRKEFRISVNKVENTKFFTNEIKELLTKNNKNQFTLLNNKLQEFDKK